MIESLVAVALHAILVSLVLSALLFGVVALVVRCIALDAKVRHILWTVALCATALMPLAGVAVSATRAVAVATDGRDAAWPGVAAGSSQDARRATQRVTERQTGRTTLPPSANLGAHPPTRSLDARLRPNRTIALVIVGIWLAGALAGLTGLALSLNRVRGLKRRSLPLEGELANELPWLTDNGPREREIYLRLSYEIETPVAVGFRRPVILIPTELATTGGLRNIEALVMHEHAHLRRRDDWTNVFQRIIERVFWFNPLVWLFGRRIALEREIASDDAVVAETGRPADYAKSLWQLAREMRMPEHSVVAPGALFTRKQITIRIEALLERRPILAQWQRIAALTVGIASVAFTVAVAATAPALEVPAHAEASAARIATLRAAPAAPSVASVGVAPVAPQPSPAIRLRVAEPPAFPATPSPSRRATHGAGFARATHGPGEADRHAVAFAQAPSELAQVPSIVSSVVSSALVQGLHAAASSIDAERTHAGAQGGLDFSGDDMSGQDLRGRDLRGANFDGVNLSGADFRGARLDGARLTGTDLSGARLTGASLRDALLSGTNIEGVSFRGVDTHGMRIFGVSFAEMDLRDFDVRGMLAKCVGCNLEGANLSGADLHELTLNGANLENANLRNTNLSGAHLNGANFSSADLRNADLRNASLVGSSFSDADLSGAKIDGANFAGSNLESATH